ncbi:MAG: outer membrane beta-barrel protein [Methylocystis sp.]
MTNKAFLTGIAFAVVVATPTAFAADLPTRKSSPAFSPAAPIFTWTGLYVGVNQGFGGGVLDANVSLVGPGLLSGTQTTNRANGFFAGGDVGYDYQFSSNVVLGAETDMQWSDVQASHQATTWSSTGAVGSGNANIRNNLNWFGTTRLRLGYSFGRLLPYVTGGVAYGEVAANGEQFVGGAMFNGSATQTTVGWVAGAGLEYALSNNLSARAEYIYMQLPGVSGPASGLTPPPFPPLTGSFSTGSFGTHMIRTGLNWNFGGPDSLSRDGFLSMLFAPPTLDWTGFYAGVTGGYGGDRTDAVVNLASALPVASSTQTQNHTSGFLAGGQLGYNRQLANHLVVGLETDAQWSGMKASHQASSGPGAYALTDISNGLDWFGTTRARLGWASGSTLTYVTGGVAYGDVSARGLQISGGLFSGSVSQTKVGWTIGGGVEYALCKNLSLKAEYLYVQFGGVDGSAYGIAPAPIPPFAGSFSTGTFGAHVTRVGLNWRFGGQSSAPIVAKY